VLGSEAADHLARFLDLAGVEPGGRLVEEQHLGRAQERLGQAEALAVALRELEDLVTEHLLEPAGGGHALDLGRDGAAPDALHLGHEAQVGRDVERVVEGWTLGKVADQARRVDVVGRHVAAGHQHAALAGRGVAGDHAHGGGLARAVGAEEPDDLTPGDREGQLVDDGPGAVTLGDRLEGDGG